ncbi:MAG: threonine--tRNA ligase, partial [Desulfobacteraceae bacterium]
ANEVKISLERAGLRAALDSRAESLNKKIRVAQLNKIPLMVTIGSKEKESGTLSVRTLDGKVQHGISRENFLNKVDSHIQERQLELDIFKK